MRTMIRIYIRDKSKGSAAAAMPSQRCRSKERSDCDVRRICRRKPISPFKWYYAELKQVGVDYAEKKGWKNMIPSCNI